ncbi:hypothetical protein CDD81_1778 [Ophiocordyceps australis]|uniref:Uncharacterized protein n=1 Tax=Ophiocordyceps australis TaxID=1399860 RepID=A0A2C5YEH7_9HYPO|nr:hypothetical protein CDD81_1778 [Ophiocordyceps australis]
MAIIFAHITVLVITSGLFLTRTRHSFLSNAWPTIAQVSVIEEAQRVLDPDLTDLEVFKQLKTQKLHEMTCRMRRRNGLLEAESHGSQEALKR